MTRWRAVWFKYWIPIALMPRTLWSAWAIEIGQYFLHRSCKTLDQVDFNHESEDQTDMFTNECEGMCGV